MAKETLVGDPPGTQFSSWSDSNSWASGTVPRSSNGLHVRLNVSSYANVGFQEAPFQTNDIVAASQGLFLGIGGPSPDIPGFLAVHDIHGVDDVVLASGFPGGAVLHVQHDLDNVRELRFYSQG